MISVAEEQQYRCTTNKVWLFSGL